MKNVILLCLAVVTIWDVHALWKAKADKHELAVYLTLVVLAIVVLSLSLFTDFTILQTLGL